MFLQRVLQLLLCSIVMQNIQIFYGGPAMFIVIYLFPCFQTRNFLPKDRNTIIKQHLHGEGLLSFCLCSKLFFNRSRVYCSKSSYVHQISQKKLVSGLLIQVISPKVLQESTTILQLKVYFVYVIRKLVEHPPWQECTDTHLGKNVLSIWLCSFSHLSAMQDL